MDHTHLTPTEISRLRADCPGLPGLAYFNNAGVGLASRSVIETVTRHLVREAEIGGKSAEAEAEDRLARTTAAAARVIGADADEITFAGSGTEAWGRAVASLPPFTAGDRILIGRHEWGGNIATFERIAERTGATVAVIPSRDDGTVCPDALRAMIDDRVKLVALTWCPANGGLINPAAAIGAVTRAAEIPFIIDASQAVGQIPVDVGTVQCDMLTTPGRKHLRGPRGTGLLYIRRAFLDRLDPPWRDAHPTPDGRLIAPGVRLQSGEQSIALLLGLGRALDTVLDLGIGRIRAHLQDRADLLRTRLDTIPGVTVRDLGTERSAIVSFTLDRGDHAAALAYLAKANIILGGNGIAYTPHDMNARGLSHILRASPHLFTDDADIDRLATTLAGFLAGR